MTLLRRPLRFTDDFHSISMVNTARPAFKAEGTTPSVDELLVYVNGQCSSIIIVSH